MKRNPNRRRLLGVLAAVPLLGPATGFAQPARPATCAIPATGETIPLVGLGTWIAFNVGNDRAARDASAEGCGLLRRQRTPTRRHHARAHDRLRGGPRMSEWRTYSLSDLLLFRRASTYRLFELHNPE